MSEPEQDAEIPEATEDHGPSAASDEPSGSTITEKAEGKVVDAAAGHQADKPAVEGDPEDQPNPDSGTERPSDFE